MKPFRALILGAALAMTLPLAAAAHGVDVSQLTHGPNGGMLGSSGETWIELAAGEGVMTVWLTTHDGAPVDTAGMTGTATIQHGQTRTDLTLAPAGDHMLAVKDPAIAPVAGDHISLQSVLPDGEPIEARFEVKPHH